MVLYGAKGQLGEGEYGTSTSHAAFYFGGQHPTMQPALADLELTILDQAGWSQNHKDLPTSAS